MQLTSQHFIWGPKEGSLSTLVVFVLMITSLGMIKPLWGKICFQQHGLSPAEGYLGFSITLEGRVLLLQWSHFLLHLVAGS